MPGAGGACCKLHEWTCRVKRDAKANPDEGIDIAVAADMQKIMMLPYMPGVKSCAFVNRLVAFNQTFAPTGEQRKKTHPQRVIVIVWHEAISGRNAADVTSAFLKAISLMAKDNNRIVIWCNNCAAQNKNWTLYTTLARLIYAPQGSDPVPDEIIHKYLETGHIFLSADSFHGLVEKNMQKKGKVNMFPDFVSVVETCGGAPKTVPMAPQDFQAWDKRVTGGKTTNVPYLKDLKEVKFVKGSCNYKKQHEDVDFQELDFLMKAQREMSLQVNHPKQNMRPRGIPTWKRNGTIKALGSLMAERKKMFWETLPTEEAADALADKDDTLDMDM